jgi:hypothetical protein
MVEKYNIRKMQHERYGLMIENLVKELEKTPLEELNDRLPSLLKHHSVAKAIYVLDQNGLQVTTMFVKTEQEPRRGIFRLPPKGTDYSMRDYFYTLVEPGFNRENYTSEPYISPATGLFCLTISTKLKNPGGRALILCVDVVPTYLKNMGRLMTLFGGTQNPAGEEPPKSL